MSYADGDVYDRYYREQANVDQVETEIQAAHGSDAGAVASSCPVPRCTACADDTEDAIKIGDTLIETFPISSLLAFTQPLSR